MLQLTQPDITATLQLLLSAQLALATFARRAVPPRPPTLAGRLWGAASESLRRRLGFAAAKGAKEGASLASVPFSCALVLNPPSSRISEHCAEVDKTVPAAVSVFAGMADAS